tara:strand:+ start:558 stop:1652 length:1095 start_codon:yes stop_codon:yes gene_type:complete
MHTFYKVISLLSLILLMVNPSFAIINQLSHDESLEWPTDHWPENKIQLDDQDFKKIIDYTFSTESIDTLGRTNALLIVQNGSIVYEKYNEPINRNTKLISYSMAKSYIGLLTGMMIDKGFIESKDEKNLLKEWQDNRKNISISHLLNMQSGLDFVEQYDNNGRSDTLEMLFGNGRFDQASFAASFALKSITPGMKFNYSTGETNILSKIIKLRLQEQNLNYQNFINDNLSSKIGLKNTIFEFDDSGTFIGGSSVFANARDYARFGYLYLRDGQWDGETIVSKSWIDDTRKPAKNTYKMYSNKFWMPHPASRIGPKDTYYCAGFGGQYILMIPSKDMVVVRLGETYVEDDKVLENLSEIINFFPK